MKSIEIEILPTNTSPETLEELSQTSESLRQFAKWIQLDLSDGVFVPVVSWPYQSGQRVELEELAREAALPHAGGVNYEVHLMAQKPQEAGILLARAGAKRIIGHIEAFGGQSAVVDAFAEWKDAGTSEVGLAVLLETPLASVEPLVSECDVVQLMSIAQLGRQGAPYEPSVVWRIKELHEKYPELVIAVDGGVSEANIAELVQAGATRFGVGSAISKNEDPKAAYESLKALAESALKTGDR